MGLAPAPIPQTGILAVPVRHPRLDKEMWPVVSRPGKGRTPWYLLTNEPIATPDDAWRVVVAYARRWQIEMCYRACKTDLAMESPRLWFWENRLKLLLMVSLVYAFSFPYWPKTPSPWSRTCSEDGAIEQESGTANPRRAEFPLARLSSGFPHLPGNSGMTHVNSEFD